LRVASSPVLETFAPLHIWMIRVGSRYRWIGSLRKKLNPLEDPVGKKLARKIVPVRVTVGWLSLISDISYLTRFSYVIKYSVTITVAAW